MNKYNHSNEIQQDNRRTAHNNVPTILASLLGKHTQVILKVNAQTRGSKPYPS
jgi:hypothetical protein